MRILARRLLLSTLVALLVACQAPRRPDPVPDAETTTSPEAAKPEAAEPSPPPRAAPTPPDAAATVPIPPPGPMRAQDVWMRLARSLADPPCVKDRVVQRWEQTYGRWPPRMRANLEAILPLMALVLDELEAHHLPGEFALLPIVESWYRPDAGSPRTAYGMWQFTTGTARHQGLRVRAGYDERLAPQASTRAAMRYLATLQNRFGDWKLANMAYNAGEYRLLRALAKAPAATASSASAARHLPPGLSATTYEHLAKVQALACLLTQPQRFGLELPMTLEVEPLQAVTLPADLDTIDAAAHRAGLDVATMRRLNPAFLQGRVVADAPRTVVLPRSAARTLLAAAVPATQAPARPPIATRDAPSGTPRDYRVRRGDTLGAIAQRFNLRLRDLLQWNRLDVRALIRPGQRLRLEP